MNKIISGITSAVQFVEVSVNASGQRLDNYLIRELKGVPKSRIYRIIRKGEVRVNKKRVKPEYKLLTGDCLRIPPVNLPDSGNSEVTISNQIKQQLESSILFENDELIVINKPSGLAVHTGSGLHYGVIDVFRQIRADTDIELVHRLDRDTSGCLMLAKHRPALVKLQQLLKDDRMQKCYQAVVKGWWNPQLQRIDLALIKQTMSNGEKRVYVDERGQPAVTLIDSVSHFEQCGLRYSFLDIRLLTGRTHQIRVHCQSQQHEIAGDSKYGDRAFNRDMKKLSGKRLLLHARRLEIPENDYTRDLCIEAPTPDAFLKIKP